MERLRVSICQKIAPVGVPPDLTKLFTEIADGHRPFIELDLSGNSLIPDEKLVCI
jgi:hypothetical protein